MYMYSYTRIPINMYHIVGTSADRDRPTVGSSAALIGFGRSSEAWYEPARTRLGSCHRQRMTKRAGEQAQCMMVVEH